MKQKLFLPLGATIAIGIFSVVLWSYAAPVEYTAPPEMVHFKPASNAVHAITYCSLCHSADYIETQPTLPREKWKAIVTKMQKVYGAPIPDSEIDSIVDYLVKTYGAEKTAEKK